MTLTARPPAAGGARSLRPRLVRAAAGVLAGLPLALGLSACGENAECLDTFYTFAETPGEVDGSYRDFDLTTLESATIVASPDNDSGTLDLRGNGQDAVSGDDDDSAGGARAYEGLATLESWNIDIQFLDEFPTPELEGVYNQRASGSDCETYGNKCFDMQVKFNGSEEEERFRVGRLEMFPPSGSTVRGCLFISDSEGDTDASVKLYFET